MIRHWWQLTGEFSHSCTCLWKPASCDNSFLKAKQQLSLWHTLEIQQVSYGLLQWLLLHFLKEPVSPSTLLLWKVYKSLNPPFPQTFYHLFLWLIYKYRPLFVSLMVKDGQYQFLPSCYSMHKRQIHFPIFLNLDWSCDLFWLISILQKCQASPLGVWQLPLSFSKLVNGKSTTSLRSPICEETQATEDETPRCWTYEWSFSDLPA